MDTIHPEELLFKAHTGQLSDAEKELLADHLESCSLCKFVLRSYQDFAQEDGRSHNDNAIAQRISARVLTDPLLRQQARQKKHSLPILAAAGLLLFISATSSATIWYMHKVKIQRTDVKKQQPKKKVVKSVNAPLPKENPRRLSPSKAKRQRSNRSSKQRSKPKTITPQSSPSAETLMQAALVARREGNYSAAKALYLELIADYPQSREAKVSGISLAKLLLEQLDQPKDAIVQYRSYLANSTSRTLAEEARVGIAKACEKLGDSVAAKTAWRELLQHHPGSLHADRARQVLGEQKQIGDSQLVR